MKLVPPVARVVPSTLAVGLLAASALAVSVLAGPALPVSAAAPFPYDVTVLAADGSAFSVTVEEGELLSDLRRDIQSLSGLAPDRQRLVFSGRQLEDGYPLGLGVVPGSTIHLLPVTTVVWSDDELGRLTADRPFADRVRAVPPGADAPVYSVSAGALPDGVRLDPASGAVAGTPTTPGQEYVFDLAAAAGASRIATSFAGEVAAPYLGDGHIQQVFVRMLDGRFLTLDVLGSDSTENIKTKVQDLTGIAPDEQLPYYAGRLMRDGRTLDDYGVIDETFIDLVTAVALAWTDRRLAAFSVGTAYADALAGTVQNAAPNYALVSGTLPAGIGFDPASGVFSGTPAEAGNYDFWISAFRDGATIVENFSGSVAAGADAAPGSGTDPGADAGADPGAVAGAPAAAATPSAMLAATGGAADDTTVPLAAVALLLALLGALLLVVRPARARGALARTARP